MKIGVLSDTHINYDNSCNHLSSILPEKGAVDVMILPGDISTPDAIPEILINILSHLECPIVFVPGNHDYYTVTEPRRSMAEIEYFWRNSLSGYSDIHILQNQGVEILGVDFFGSTWWSGLWSDEDREQIYLHEDFFPDFKLIVRLSNTESRNGAIPLRMMDLPIMNAEAKFSYRKWWSETKGKRRVLVTHFPMLLSLRHQAFPPNPYFVSNDEEFIKRYPPEAIIFGHTHWNIRRHVNGILCASNMYGYEQEVDNISFEKNFSIIIY